MNDKNERDRRLAEERRELLKMKAGIADETEIADITEKPPEKVLTAKEKVANFWYHEKGVVIISVLAACVLFYLVYNTVTRVDPDVKILLNAKDGALDYYSSQMEAALAPYCPDFNGDGKVYVEIIYTPPPDATGLDPSYVQAMSAKLFMEFSSDSTIIVLIEPDSAKALDVTEDVFDDPAEWFSDSADITKLGYKVSATNLSSDLGYSLDPELAAAFRFPKQGMGNYDTFEQNYKNAHIFWQNFIDGNAVSADSNIYKG
jgi:hypothetical protein